MTERQNTDEVTPVTEKGVRPARVFMALRIAPEIAHKLAQYAEGLKQFSVRPVAAVDIHLTLVPPWNEASMPNAVETLRRVVGRFSPFTLTFRHIGYGPEPGRPRFLWAECEASNELVGLRAALLRIFGQTDPRPFRPHVTLARLRDKGPRIARKRPVNQDIVFTQRVDSVDLMLSSVGASGYEVLASLSLGENRELPSGA